MTNRMVDYFTTEGFTHFGTAWMNRGFCSKQITAKYKQEATVSFPKGDGFIIATVTLKNNRHRLFIECSIAWVVRIKLLEKCVSIFCG